MNTPRKTPILAFYSGKGQDNHGRGLYDILGADDNYLAHFEDYIQWLFPLDTPSSFRPEAPVLTASDIEAFRSDPNKQKRLCESLQRMLAFYGFAITTSQGQCTIGYSEDFAEQSDHWLTEINDRRHNFMRISRILKSLALLGLLTEAVAFLAILEDMYKMHSEIIGEEVLSFWRNAIPPEIPPCPNPQKAENS